MAGLATPGSLNRRDIMLLLLVSMLLSSSAYTAGTTLCKINIDDTKNKTSASLALERWTTNEDKIILQRDNSTKDETIRVSYELDGSMNIEPEEVDVPDKTTVEINNKYKQSIALIKKGKPVTSGKGNSKTLMIKTDRDKSLKCSDQNLAIMLFFIQNWFYAK